MSKLLLSGGFQHKNKLITVKLGLYSFEEDGSFIVYCPALDLSAYGDTEEYAQKCFEEKLEIYIQYCLNKGTLIEDLQAHGWNIKSLKQRKVKAPTLDFMMSGNKPLKDILSKENYKVHRHNVSLPVA